MELSLLLTLDLREQAALQAALVTHGAPDALVTLALTGACRISSLEEARQLRKWLAEARTANASDFPALYVIATPVIHFVLWSASPFDLILPTDALFSSSQLRAIHLK